MSEKKQNLIPYISLAIVIVINLVVVGIAWGNNSAKIEANFQAIEDQKEEQVLQRSDIVEMKIKLERIDTNVKTLLNRTE